MQIIFKTGQIKVTLHKSEVGCARAIDSVR